MRYGFFDDKKREYVITRPDTPAPWANYLGSPEYGALISNNAGGYSFVKSGANGRILRYIFDGKDRPGRYLYLRDSESGDYWSASWQPVGKSLDLYESECRHGLGYTRIKSSYGQITSRTLWYVPEGCAYEVWELSITNDSARRRELTVTGFAEFTNHSNYEQDGVNLQYSRYISRTSFRDHLLVQQIHGNLADVMKNRKSDQDGMEERFFGLAGAEVSSYCGDRESFLGMYRDYRNPIGVERGNLGDIDSYNEYSCGALSAEISLEAGESRTLVFVLGAASRMEAEKILRGYEGPELCEKEVGALRAMWERRLGHFQVKTPCPEFDTMINTWNAYNCFMTFIWSRAASFTYCGLRNGYGYRDTVQDIHGIIHLEPEMAAEKIRFMLTAQAANGAGLPLVKFTHNPGHEDTPDDPSYVKATGHPAYRADDALWLFPTVYKYISESGNTAFLDEVLPYANEGEGTVYEHLLRAIRFSMEHLGPHGLPAGLYADWNDCLRLGEQGESSFVAFQFFYALTIQKVFADLQGEAEDAKWLSDEKERFGALASGLLWDEDRYIRGFTDKGAVIGARDDAEANLWLNPQSWSVISGLADDKRANCAMGLVKERLNSDYGAMLMMPPYHEHAFPGALAVIFNQGAKENSGIFSQSQGWLVLAEAFLGHGDAAFTYWKENAPSIQNERAEIRKLEPYCYGQFTEGVSSPHFGRSHVHWLTGTASTMMVGAVEGILGMRPDPEGLRIAPSLPSDWESVAIEKEFRGKKLHIRIENPDHRESGWRSFVFNGQELSDNYLLADQLKDENEVVLKM